MQTSGYTIGDHPTDLELWVRAPDRKELFITAARAILDYTAPSVTPGDPTSRQIHLTASDPEELLFLLETEEICFREISIQ